MPLRLVRLIALPLLAGAAASAMGVSRRRQVPDAPRVYVPLEPQPEGDTLRQEMRTPGPSRFRPLGIYLTLGAAVLTGAGVYAGYQIKFTKEARARAVELTAGDPDRGRALVRRYGCAGCHTIPGVAGASGKVGPDLTGVAARVYLGGVINNTPDNMIQWIVNPREIDAQSAMPRTGISHVEARHVAAYLYTLR